MNSCCFGNLDVDLFSLFYILCLSVDARQRKNKHKDKQTKVPTARLGSCPDPGLNRGHLDLQSNALPTELPRPTGSHSENRSTVPVPSPHRHLYSR